MVELVRQSDDRVISPRLEIASTFVARFWGWQFRPRPADDAAIAIVPCHSVHTCWMRFAIDVAFLDGQGSVLSVITDLRPWRFTWPVRGALIAIEFPSGGGQLQPGDRCVLRAMPGLPPLHPALANMTKTTDAPV